MNPDDNRQIRMGDALIIVPAFGISQVPSLAAHILQACAQQAGIRVHVLYANLIMAALIGRKANDAICGHFSSSFLLGDRLFARMAYGLPPLGRRHERLDRSHFLKQSGMTVSNLLEIERMTERWTETTVAEVVRGSFSVVGCTTFAGLHQTSASVALLKRIKRLAPEVVTVIGGGACVGEMAEGIASLCDEIDYVFSGESETTFPMLLKRVREGNLPSERVINGQPCTNLDAIPTPQFDDYFCQFAHYFPDARPEDTFTCLETSRGCAWGEKQQCTFCGLHASKLGFRTKSVGRVIVELRELAKSYPSRCVGICDNMVSHQFARTLMPRLRREVPDMHLDFEMRSNLLFEDMVALRDAGISRVMLGIEALSTSLLKRMRKGTSAAQNIATLRYARCLGIWVTWNLLYGFPGDERRDYDDTLALLRLLNHFSPPRLGYVAFQRFSPYVECPQEHGLSEMRPMEAYAECLPAHADLEKVASYFEADCTSFSRDNSGDTIEEIRAEIERWQAKWQSSASAPCLHIARNSDSAFILRDTRGLASCSEFRLLSKEEAILLLIGDRGMSPAQRQWALREKIAAEVDGAYVPIATSSADLIRYLLDCTR